MLITHVAFLIMLTCSILLTNTLRVEMRSTHRSASLLVQAATRKGATSLLSTHAFSHRELDYCIRQADADDVASINLCNRANLPENYGSEFYNNQLRKFPELTLVAERKDSKELIGYALGQIRPQPHVPGMQFFSPAPAQYEGHVASIAVHKEYRGYKVAMNLMNILHQRVANEYGMDRVSLYCRGSNKAALQLYEKTLKYNVEQVVPQYYADMEDGYYMVASGLLQQPGADDLLRPLEESRTQL